MLTITVPTTELWDEQLKEFVYVNEQTLQLEHSLVSISKWESKWHVPFFSDKKKTDEQIRYYIKCMTITQNVSPEIYKCLTEVNYSQISEYIDDSMTATWFSKEENSRHQKEIITSEIIYYWMIANNIPVEFQKWHINRLLTLIRVCNSKNAPPKKMSKKQTASQYASLNAQRRKLLNSKG